MPCRVSPVDTWHYDDWRPACLPCILTVIGGNLQGFGGGRLSDERGGDHAGQRGTGGTLAGRTERHPDVPAGPDGWRVVPGRRDEERPRMSAAATSSADGGRVCLVSQTHVLRRLREDGLGLADIGPPAVDSGQPPAYTHAGRLKDLDLLFHGEAMGGPAFHPNSATSRWKARQA